MLSLSESFSREWPMLASEAGLGLVVLRDAGEFERLTGAVGIIAGAGEEHRITGVLNAARPKGMPLGVVGALADHRVAAAVVRGGAAAYFALPGDFALLREWVNESAVALRAVESATAFTAAERGKYRFEGILGSSAALHAALDRAARVIPHANVTVLLSGETGTGKELLARALHYEGPRHAAPFVDVNCSAIPESLLESELFGHEKGAFTSATGTKPGLFELADGGTIFLDEIGHLALSLQGKLLRVLEERTLRRVGGMRTIAVDVRIIAATHVDLAAAVQRGEFREDLFYRLNVVPVELPPLRARPEDIVPLAEHFLARFAADYGMPAMRITDDAANALRAREWAGNIRELRNTVERAVLLSRGGSLGASDFEAAPARAPAAHAAIPFPAPLHAIVAAAVEGMLALCGGNKSEAARRLDISRPRLLRLLGGAAAAEGDLGDRDAPSPDPAPDGTDA